MARQWQLSYAYYLESTTKQWQGPAAYINEVGVLPDSGPADPVTSGTLKYWVNGQPVVCLGSGTVASAGLEFWNDGQPETVLGASASGIQTVTLSGIPSASAFGTLTTVVGAVSRTLTGIPSASAFGSVTTHAVVSKSLIGIPSASAFGSVTTHAVVSKSLIGIPSANIFGTVTKTVGAVSRTLTGIPSASAFGTVTKTVGAVSRTLTGIPSASAFGTVTTAGVSVRTLTGIPSASAFGTVTKTVGAVSRTLTGIPSAATLGTVTKTVGAVSRTLTGIPSANIFGSVTTHAVVSKSLTGIPSANIFGSVTTHAVVSKSLSGIPSANIFGTVTKTVGAVSRTLTGISSAEAFGTFIPYATVNISLSNIPSAEALGLVTSYSNFNVSLVGISSAEEFGILFVSTGTIINVSGISSVAAFGTPIALSNLNIPLFGIESAELFGIVGASIKSVSLAQAFGMTTVAAMPPVARPPRPLDNSPFAGISIGNKITGGTAVVTWQMARHFVDPQPWVFQLQYSSGEVPDLDEWIDIGSPVVNTFTISDPIQRMFGKSLEFAYRIKLITPLNIYYARPSLLRKWNKHDWCIVREMIRKENLMNRVFIAVQGYFLKAKRYGIVCTASTDPLTGEILNSDCEICYGTGFVGGYYDPLLSQYMDITNNITREHRSELQTEKKDIKYGRFIDFPSPIQGDAWINKDTDQRFYIHTVKELGVQRGYPFIWQVELRQAPFTDILYQVPLPDHVHI